MAKATYCAILLAAGTGNRFKSELPKQYNKLLNKPIINYSLETFIASAIFDKIIVVVQKPYKSLCLEYIGPLSEYVEIIEGGDTRQASSYKALAWLEPQAPDYVFIHDVARPLISLQKLHELKANLSPEQGAIVAIPLQNTIKQVHKNYIQSTIARSNLYAAQTPQAFPYEAIYNAHKKFRVNSNIEFTDDSQIAEQNKLAIKIIEGEANNIKITWDIDLLLAEQILKRKS